MYIIVVAIHIFACLVLIAVILLQAGRGGGLAEVFGGGSADTILGTKTATFMTRATSICAIVFLCTSIALAVIFSHRRSSLLAGVRTKQGNVTETTETSPAKAVVEEGSVEVSGSEEEDTVDVESSEEKQAPLQEEPSPSE